MYLEDSEDDLEVGDMCSIPIPLPLTYCVFDKAFNFPPSFLIQKSGIIMLP